MVAIDHRGEEHAGSRLEISDVLAALNNISGNVAARNLRKWNSRHSGTYKEIEMIERDGLYADQNLILSEHRVWNVFVFEDFRTAVLVEANRLHRLPRKQETLPRGLVAPEGRGRRILSGFHGRKNERTDGDGPKPLDGDHGV
jgi:hypothetical protein